LIHTLVVGPPQQATLHTRLDPQIATGALNSAITANITDIIPTYSSQASELTWYALQNLMLLTRDDYLINK